MDYCTVCGGGPNNWRHFPEHPSVRSSGQGHEFSTTKLVLPTPYHWFTDPDVWRDLAIVLVAFGVLFGLFQIIEVVTAR